MKKNESTLESLKNLGKKDDYNLGLGIYRQMKDKGFTDTLEYLELGVLLSQFYYGIAAQYDLHYFLKRIGANVLETNK